MPTGRVFAGIVAVLAAWVGIGVASSGGSLAPGGEPTRVRAEIVPELSALIPGRVNVIGVRFRIEPGWHLYGHGLNDTGSPPVIQLALPDGWEAMEPVWPTPRRKVSYGTMLDHIYEGTLVVMVPVRVPEGARGLARVSATLSWVVCSDVCEFGDGRAEAELPIAGADEVIGPGPRMADFLAARSRHVSMGPAPEVVARVDGGRLSVRVAGARSLVFYPDRTGAVPSDLIREGETPQNRGDGLRISLTPRTADGERAERVSGILEIVGTGVDESGSKDPESRRFVRIDLPLSPG